MIACRNGSKSLVELLVGRGADVNRTSDRVSVERMKFK